MKRDLRSIKNMAQLTPETISDAQSAIEHYGTKSNSELMSELISLKNSGAINDTQLSEMARTLGPMLTPEQQTKLSSLISQLK